ncbi:MAG: hypothetical protein R3E35_13485 [Rhodocyclaceae bacterium]
MREKRGLSPITPITPPITPRPITPRWPPIILCWAMALGLIGLLTSQPIMANQQLDDESFLSEIVSNTVKIMRRNGYEMPEYRVIDGGTDVPISGPPEKYAFFGYLEKSWLQDKRTIVLHFYEANLLPSAGRIELINYLVSLHVKQRGGFALTLRMMKDNYKKGQIIRPDAFLEIKLNRIEN